MDRKVSFGLGSDVAGGPRNRSDREFQSGGCEGPRGRDAQKADRGNRTRDGRREPHPLRTFLGLCSSGLEIWAQKIEFEVEWIRELVHVDWIWM